MKSKWIMVLFCAIVMAYGWGWRGIYGHTAGAMVPGALVGMAICLASGREDWHRRTLVAGLLGAIGWAWGGTLTNMEQRFYIMSDTAIDVIYGFAGIGFVGMLWAGIGGATLAMAFTRSRSELNRYFGPLLTLGISFLLARLCLDLFPEIRQSYGTIAKEHFHDNNWLAPLIAVTVLPVYWAAVKRDRPATRLCLTGAVAWWIGYLGLTKFGGLELAPPYRSEAWAGVLALMLVLLWHHWKQNDRAALLFTLYSMLAGSIGFIIALQIHVPFASAWGSFEELHSWKTAEETFGFLMGGGVALGAVKLLSGHLSPPPEDDNRFRLDSLGVLVLLVYMLGLTLKKNLVVWTKKHELLPDIPIGLFDLPLFQLKPVLYVLMCSFAWIMLVVYTLVIYRRGQLRLLATTPWSKGALVFIAMIVLTVFGNMTLLIPALNSPGVIMETFSISILAIFSVGLLVSVAGFKEQLPAPSISAENPAFWKPTRTVWALFCWLPLHIFLASFITLGILDGPWKKEFGLERHRFGPNATWKLKELEEQGKLDKDAYTPRHHHQPQQDKK